jgi:hypothetical protein
MERKDAESLTQKAGGVRDRSMYVFGNTCTALGESDARRAARPTDGKGKRLIDGLPLYYLT